MMFLFVRVASSQSGVDNRYTEECSFGTSNANRPLPVPPERYSTYETVPCDNQKTTTVNSALCNASGKPLVDISYCAFCCRLA